MLARKEESCAANVTGQDLSPAWIVESTKLITQLYKEKLETTKKKLTLWGQWYPTELLLVVTLTSTEREMAMPVSFFLSADLNLEADQNDLDQRVQILTQLFDLFDLAMDDYFSQVEGERSEDEDQLFEPVWQEEERGDFKFYFKVSREDPQLTLLANRLLEKGMHDDPA